MLSSILASNFNLFEGVFWLLLGIAPLALRVWIPQLYKTLACFASVMLITFGISDFVQHRYGSFLLPGMEWLLVWKIINVIGLVVIILWYLYVRLTHSSSIANSTDTGQ